MLGILMLTVLTACIGPSDRPESPDDDVILQTVNGPVAPDSLGFTLSHEHLFSNFGLPIGQTHSYDESDLLSQVIPYLNQLHERGIETIVDYTTAYFGRRADLLKKLSDSTGIKIITNTGIYGGADDRYVPAYAYEASATEIAERWTEEAESGIDNTGIRPGFIKLAFDEGSPSDVDRKLFEAGLLTHLQTSLTVAVHTGSNPEAVELQLDLLDEYGIDPSAWIWTHANWHDQIDYILEVAQQGAWISMDGVNTDNVDHYLDYIRQFEHRGVLDRLLLSHDGDGYPAGGEIRPFEAISSDLIPALRQLEHPDDLIQTLFVDNPRKAYAIGIRRSE